MEVINFQENQEEGTPNTWKQVRATDGTIQPLISDSNGDYFGLASHKILPDGTVKPSVVCPYGNGCNFHEFIKLVGWDKITEKKQE